MAENISEEEVFDGGQADDFNPFAQNVVEREYTKQGAGGKGVEDEPDEPEEITDAEEVSDAEIVEEDDDDIPEPTYSAHASAENEEEGEVLEGEDVDADKASEPHQSSFSNNKKDATPKEKRKMAEAAADLFLMLYARYLPVPFIKWGKINEAQMEQLQMEKMIDLGVIVNVEGENMTIREFMQSFNMSVEEAIVITESEIKDLREPLVDYMMEQGIELTPLQKMAMTMGMQMFGMFAKAFQFSKVGKGYVDSFKEQSAAANKQAQPHSPTENQEYRSAASVMDEEVLTDSDSEADPFAEAAMEVVPNVEAETVT